MCWLRERRREREEEEEEVEEEKKAAGNDDYDYSYDEGRDLFFEPFSLLKGEEPPDTGGGRVFPLDATFGLLAAWPLQDIVSLRGCCTIIFFAKHPLNCAIYCTILPVIAPPAQF